MNVLAFLQLLLHKQNKQFPKVWYKVYNLQVLVCQTEITPVSDLYVHNGIEPLTHTHTHTDCMKLLGHTVPLGKALSVAMVPFTAFSRSLLLSLAALTLPFSPATLSAFSTQNEHTRSKWAPPFDLMPRQPMKSLAELGMDGKKKWIMTNKINFFSSNN